MCGERAATILRTASEQAAQLKQQIQALGQTFDLTLVHSLHLDTAIAELRIAAWWSWLKPAFWNARSQYRQIARGLTKDSLAMANDLELLRNHTASCRAFAANAEVAAACGHEFRGLDSDFATLERTASWAGVVRQKLQGRTALEQRLRTFLLEGASTDLQVFANEWDSNASAFGVATQAEQSCRDRKAEEIAADKDAAAEAADRLANWASQLRLPDSSDGATTSSYSILVIVHRLGIPHVASNQMAAQQGLSTSKSGIVQVNALRRSGQQRDCQRFHDSATY